MKKLTLIILTILLIQVAYAKTGIVIDVHGEIYSGCIDSDSDYSAYDVIKDFDAQQENLDITIDGELTGMPFLRAINGIEGETIETNSFSGWNFWIKGIDEFTSPPELAPGWGMGIGDYIISEQDVIGVNFAITQFNPDWTIKTAPIPPNYISYEDLCEKLEIEDIEIKVDNKEDKGTIEVKAGSEIEIELKLKNKDDQVSLEDVYFEAEIKDIDEGDDIEKESATKDLSPKEDKKFDVDFTLPKLIEDDEYELVIRVYSTDEYGLEYNKELYYDIEVDKENHEITLEKFEATPYILDCREEFNIDLELMNTGKKDEDISLTIDNPELGILKEESFEIDEGEGIEKKYILNIDKNGEFDLNLKIEYGTKDIEKTTRLTRNCKETTEKEPVIVKQEKKTEEKEIEITITKDTAVIPLTKKEEPPYLMFGVIAVGLFVAMVNILLLLFKRK